jgi:ATP synthase protein I
MTHDGHEPGKDRLRNFERRLEQSLQSQGKSTGPDKTEGTAAGLAMRVITELVVGILVCMGLGWMADKYFGTAPWIMLAFMPFGFAAGIVNVMRLSRSKQADAVLGGKGPVAPSVKDDEDED